MVLRTEAFFLIFSFILIFGETSHSVIYSAAPCKMVLFICAGIYVFIFLNYYFLKEALGVDQKLNAVAQPLITHVVVTYFDLKRGGVRDSVIPLGFRFMY